jgi:hypothetical protein
MADIKANKGTDKDYDEKKILKLVQDIKARPIGQVIVAAIENTGKQLTIRPESERPPKSFDPTLTYRKGEMSATFPVDSAGKLNHAAASPANLSRTAKDERDKWYAGMSYDEEKDVDRRYDPAPDVWGTPKGGGSDVHTFFTPGEGNDKACSNHSGLCATLPDEILLHEMVHALRMMQGVFNPVPTTGRYKNEEEFLALVITNVYISKKKGNKLLRPDYQNHYGALEPKWSTSEGFLKDDENKRILEFYSTRWQPVFGLLGDVDTPFNPFRPFKISQKPKPAKR